MTAAFDPKGWRDPVELLKPLRDDGLVLLLVDAEDHPLADTAELVVTVGYAQHVDGDEYAWLFAGWCWSHDHFTQGTGKVVGWQPLPFPLDVPRSEAPNA